MPEIAQVLLPWLVLGVPLVPLAASVVLGTWMFVVGAPSERLASSLVIRSLELSLVLAMTGALVAWHVGQDRVELGPWFEIAAYQFELGFLLDRLSITFVVTKLAMSVLVARFAVRYMHNEPGFARFFALLALAVSGMTCVVLAHSYDFLFVGWEVVGLSSVLLVAFFHERRGPVAASIAVLATYRIADLGILLGCVVLHGLYGNTLYETVLAHDAPGLSGGVLVFVGLAFLLSAMGKSAQFPLGGWLPRAMEGPTPSSALFYGALSVHAGVYLLLRSAPLLERSPGLGIAVGLVGAVTAVQAGLVARVQSDVKSQLAYATMTQLGVMLVEIGAGFPTLALFHFVAHATLRTYQLLRAPNALAEAHALRAALRHHEAPAGPASAFQRWLYRLAIDRFHADAILERLLVVPLRRIADAIAAREGLSRSTAEAPPAPARDEPAAPRSPLGAPAGDA